MRQMPQNETLQQPIQRLKRRNAMRNMQIKKSKQKLKKKLIFNWFGILGVQMYNKYLLNKR